MKRPLTPVLTCFVAMLSAAPLCAQLPFQEIPGERQFSGELIARPVQLGVRQNEARAALSTFEVRRYVWQTDEYVVAVPDGLSESAVAAELLATGAFQYVEPNWLLSPIDCPDDPDLGLQWHHNANRMQSCDGWDVHTGNPTVGVGYCDTGIRVTHEDLQLHRREAYNAVDELWESQGGSIGPVHPHGTWVTGCGSGNGDNGTGIAGVGWNLGHRMLRVSNDSSGDAYLDDLQHAARTAIESGDKVASVSYSGVDADSNLTTATYIKSIGGLLVWSAGNDGRRLSRNDRDADDIIVAGATDESDNKAGFSAYGPFVDVTAPGVNVYCTGSDADDDYDAVSGTSFSCPLTAGLCALIWSYQPSLTPDQVEAALKAGCDDLGSVGVDETFGYGRINVFGALDQLSGIGFAYPGGLPAEVELTGETNFAVDVFPVGSNPVPGTGLLYYDDGSGWASLPMNELSPDFYDAVFPGLPGADCGSEVRYYVSAEADDGSTWTDPSTAPADYFAARARTSGGEMVTVADLDFETAPGWSVENVDLGAGAWDLGVPVGGGDRGDPAADYDSSGKCWLTWNADGDTDVDGGPTRLLSPLYDLSPYGAATLSYARWFTNDDRDGDRLMVEMSDDGGVHWEVVESVGHQGEQWIVSEWKVGAFVGLTSEFRLRVSATDNPNNSVTEAGFDAFLLTATRCPLVLDLTPEQAGLTEPIRFATWKGEPGAPTLLYAIDVNGVPVTVLVDFGFFDPQGRRFRGALIPDNDRLRGLRLSFLAFGFGTLGDLETTNLEQLLIQ